DCDDMNICTGFETCVNHSCQPGMMLDCDDHNSCTDDSCDAQAGCQHANNTAPCDDASACTTNDTCSGGTCGRTAVVCTALDACHQAGTCAPATGMCSNPASPMGTPCTGGACDGAGNCEPTTTTTTTSTSTTT